MHFTLSLTGLAIADLRLNAVVPHELVNTINTAAFPQIMKIPMYLAIFSWLISFFKRRLLI